MNSRSSEMAVAQASDTFCVQFRILPVRSSVSQANAKRVKSQLSSFASLKQNSRRSSEIFPEPVVGERRSSGRQASSKRTKTKLTWIDSLKRDASRLSEIGPVRPFCVIFPKWSKPQPKLPKLFIGFIKNYWSVKNIIWRWIWCIYVWLHKLKCTLLSLKLFLVLLGDWV